MHGIIDFHTHAFPDALAEKAMKVLLEEGKKMWDVHAYLDGKVSSLIASMDKHGIEKSVVCSIATKPSQFSSIMTWSQQINSDRIIPFPSFHPLDPEFPERIRQIKAEGFRGIKFHPYYQDFIIDDDSLFPVYKQISEANLIVVMHTGYDLAFKRTRIADPVRIVRVLDTFPDLKLVTTHLGAWEDWDEVEKHLLGKQIFMEISYSLDILEPEKARKIFLNHPSECILFGTDSPWTDQGQTLSLLKGLSLGDEREHRILSGNALSLLGNG
jgi:predicted TIM-barrel fold metal-dependent hydrolase